jgi:Holliday junction resolvase
MIQAKMKGYRTERKVRMLFEKYKWKVIRAGASLGEADLICIKNGKSIFLQIKSIRKKDFYFYEYMDDKLEGLPFYLIVDFGYGKVRILAPRKKVSVGDGMLLKDFLENGCELN